MFKTVWANDNEFITFKILFCPDIQGIYPCPEQQQKTNKKLISQYLKYMVKTTLPMKLQRTLHQSDNRNNAKWILK